MYAPKVLRETHELGSVVAAHKRTAPACWTAVSQSLLTSLLFWGILLFMGEHAREEYPQIIAEKLRKRENCAIL